MTLPEANSHFAPENGGLSPWKAGDSELGNLISPGLGGENDKYLSCHQLVVCNTLGRQ